jgi:hypothetical protein
MEKNGLRVRGDLLLGLLVILASHKKVDTSLRRDVRVSRPLEHVSPGKVLTEEPL